MRRLVFVYCLLAAALAAQQNRDFRASENYSHPDPASVLARKALGKDALMPTLGGVLAHIAHGGPWRTLLTLINPGTSETARAVLSIYTTSGTPLPLTLTDGRKVVSASKFEIVLRPRAVMFLEPVGLPANVLTGFAILETETGSITGYAVFRAVVPGRPDMEAVVPLDWGVGENTWIAFDNTRGFVTSVAIANRWLYFPCELTADVYDEDGLLLASYRRVLPGMSQQAFETFREWPATAGRRGVVRLTKTNVLGGFSALALLFNPTGSVTTAPPPDVRVP